MGTGADKDKLEKWRSNAEGTVWITRMTRGEREVSPVTGGRVFHLTTEERHLNSSEAASSALDAFSNGTFECLNAMEVIEDEEDRARILTNPEALGESEMADLYKGPFGELVARVNLVSSPLVLRRMFALGREMDAGMRKVQAVEERLLQVENAGDFTNSSETVGTVEPSAGAPPPQKASYRDDMGPQAIKVR